MPKKYLLDLIEPKGWMEQRREGRKGRAKIQAKEGKRYHRDGGSKEQRENKNIIGRKNRRKEAQKGTKGKTGSHSQRMMSKLTPGALKTTSLGHFNLMYDLVVHKDLEFPCLSVS